MLAEHNVNRLVPCLSEKWKQTLAEEIARHRGKAIHGAPERSDYSEEPAMQQSPSRIYY